MTAVSMSPDTRRVLGQIERGEMRCGRDAARAIAARHQAAYGDTVWGPATSSAVPTPGQETSVPSYPRSRRFIKHADVAAELRAQPGVWQHVGEWPSTSGAENAAHRIRTAHQARMYEPAGAFEARTELTEMGAKVEARYVGHRTPAADALTSLGGGTA